VELAGAVAGGIAAAWRRGSDARFGRGARYWEAGGSFTGRRFDGEGGDGGA